ncbi:MAG: hypothetical protein V4613_00225 [Bacteroidota bacterium]
MAVLKSSERSTPDNNKGTPAVKKYEVGLKFSAVSITIPCPSMRI